MDKLTSNMTISECLKHFNPCESDLIYCYVVGQEEGAQWFTCIAPCTVDGHSVNKGDMLLFEKGSGKLCGIFTALE